MTQYNRELPNGGTVELDVETDDEIVERMLRDSVDIAINAIRNVEEASGDL